MSEAPKTLFHVVPVNFMQVGTANTKVDNSLDQHVPTHDSLRLWGRRTSQFQCAKCRAKARTNISTLALKLSRDHQMLIMFSENSGTIDGNRHTPPAPTMMRYRNYRGDPNFQP